MDDGTKTTAASAGPPLIERPRLTRILDASDARIILLVAPAGYGKTTLARQWLKDKPHVWYQATPASADPVALARGLARVATARSDRLEFDEIVRATPSLASDANALTAILLELLDEAESVPRLLVVDDYHYVLGSPHADAVLRALLWATTWRVLVTSRVAPGWPSTREVLYGEALLLQARDLAFDAAEVDEVLGARPRSLAGPSDPAIAWPLLATLVARKGRGKEITGVRPDLIYEFLTEEVLAETPPELQAMLEELAIAPSRGVIAVQHNPTLVLEAYKRGLLESSEQGAEMHPLLSDLLRRRLRERRDAMETLTRVVQTLFADSEWDEAFAIIDEFDRADLIGDLLERAASTHLREGRVETVARWEAVAKRLGFSGAILDYLAAERLARAGRHREAEQLATAVAQRLAAPARGKALILAGRSAYLGDRAADAAELFAAAFEASPGEDDTLEALVGISIAVVDGELERPPILDALASFQPGNAEGSLRITTARILESTRFGPVAEALRLVEQGDKDVVRVAAIWPRSSFLSVKALALMLSGSYEAAASAGKTALEDVKRLRFRPAIAQLQVTLGMIHIGRQDYAAAARAARQAEAEARRQDDRYFLTMSAALQTRLLVVQGLANDALHVPKPPKSPAASAANGEFAAAQALAHACTGDAGTALELAASAESTTRGIEARVLAAAARAVATGAPEHTTAAVSCAFETGNLDGLIVAARAASSLIDMIESTIGEGDRYASFTRRLISQASLSEKHPRRPRRTSQPFSPRELEVLDLLKQGLSNKQIARALYISDATVKVHLRHIYEKLGVRRRTEAIVVSLETDADD